jgi:uncharacterized repeat protein (TIGR03803 family)
MTSAGGVGEGTFFRMTPEGTLKTLAEFQSSGFVGGTSEAPLLATSDGNLYGSTGFWGEYGRGTVFKIDPAGRLMTLASFTRPRPRTGTSMERPSSEGFTAKAPYFDCPAAGN